MVSINSSISNETRLLKVSSTHVITNFMSTKLQVMCLAVPDINKIYNMPQGLDVYAFTMEPYLNKRYLLETETLYIYSGFLCSNAGVSILQWYIIDNGDDYIGNYALYIAFTTDLKLGWSCPVRVDKNLIRRSLAIRTESSSIPFVITSHEYKGQTFLAVHHDSHPQLLIENRCGMKLYCAQVSSNESNALIMDCQHFNWLCGVDSDDSCYYTMPGISEKFPDITPNGYPDHITLSMDPEGKFC